jgi:hypothetical protein
MSRRPARCTKADIARAVSVAKDCGMAVEILPDGTIRIVPSEPVDKRPARVDGERRIVL